jgi:aldehyde:ferredoxin oxidoreductase
VFDFKVFAELIRLGAGIEMTPEEVFKVGDEITRVERSFICREGVTRKDDYPPRRYFEPLKWQDGLDDDAKNAFIDRQGYDEMLTEYYVCHGWDPETGVP